MKSKKILRGRPFSGDDTSEKETKPPLAARKGLAAVSSVKTRKELRKELRKAKKAQKHQYLLVKCGREDLVKKAADAIAKEGKKKRRRRRNRKKNKKGSAGENDKDEKGAGAKTKTPDSEEDDEESEEEVDEVAEFVKEAKYKKGEDRVDPALELRKEQEKLMKGMEAIRRKRLLEENEEEERNIRELSKQLKLNKKAAIPASFRTDGLDYVLEVCEQTGGSKSKKKQTKVDSDEDESVGDEDVEDDGNPGNSDDEDEGLANESGSEELADDDDDAEVDGSDEEEDEMFGPESEEEESDQDEEGIGEIGSADSEEETSPEQEKKKSKVKEKKSKKDDGTWEDIYGRLRAKDGSVINNTETPQAKEVAATPGGKYVPPMMRGNQVHREKLVKQLKGLLNRLSESNMHSIANQIEEMYMTNSRNETNQTLLEQLCSALVRPSMTPDRVALEHIMLVAILHANVGTEVGAFFIQSFTQEFKSKYDSRETDREEEKQLHNLVQIISLIYHFKIINACLIYDILKFLGDSFGPIDIELILTILRTVGFRLRKDDPAALKELIVTLQQKANKVQSGAVGGAKVQFMLETLMAIRNNNMNKIPNYDPSFGEHLKKILKSHLHPGNYVSELKVGLKDLLNADKAGRWWIVGSAWAGNQPEKEVNDNEPAISSEDALKHAKLLKRARAQGMNTDTRRNVFCILMTAEDYVDAFEKLTHLDLRNNQDREIIHVTVYCCLQEKRFNPYYAFIVSKFSNSDRKLMYPDCFKNEIRLYAELIGQRSASRLFSISQKRIFEWVKEAKKSKVPDCITAPKCVIPSSQKKKLKKSVSNRTEIDNHIIAWIERQHPRKVPSTEVRRKAQEIHRKHGRQDISCSYGWYRRFQSRVYANKVRHPSKNHEDSLVLSWLLEKYDNNQVVCYKDLQAHAQTVLKDIRPGFKASAGWALRLLKRNHILMNYDGICKTIPTPLEPHAKTFLIQMQEILRAQPVATTSSIGCMDEVPLDFSTTSSDKNSHEDNLYDGLDSGCTSRLRKLSLKNCDATVILSLLADGTILPPMVIVKGQLTSSMNQVYNAPDSQVVAYYSNATEPTPACYERWAELVWAKHINDETGVLIVDSYELHDHLCQSLKKWNTQCLQIPSGCSLRLQPLNYLARSRFMKCMEKLWMQYLKPADDTKLDIIRLPSTNDIVKWVATAYEETKRLKEELSLSFQKTYSDDE